MFVVARFPASICRRVGSDLRKSVIQRAMKSLRWRKFAVETLAKIA